MVFIQHHGAVKPHTAIPRLDRAPLRSRTANMAHHCTWEKQPAKTNYSSVADFDCEIYSCSFVFLITSQIMEFVAAAIMVGVFAMARTILISKIHPP